jgi:hypothetical protein
MQRKVNLKIDLQNVTATVLGDSITVTIDGDQVGNITVPPPPPTTDYIDVDGQSLSVSNTDGQFVTPVNDDPRLKMLTLTGANNGPRTFMDSTRAAINESDSLTPAEITGIGTLAEVQSPSQSQYGETVCTGMGTQLLAGVDGGEIGFSVLGIGALSLDALGPTTDNFQNQHRADIAWRRESAKPVKRRARVLIHDHSHILLNYTETQQRDRLLQYVEDHQQAVYAEVKSRSEFPILLSQSGNATYAGSTNEECRRVWHGTLDAVAQSEFLHLATPMYFLPSYDGVHLTADSVSLLGEYLGKVLKYVEAGTWKHTGFDHAGTIDRTGTSLFVPCQSYSGQLKVNTDPVVARPNYGFNFEDGGGGSVTLVGNPVIDNAAGGLVFELSGTPNGGTLYSGSTATTVTQIGQSPTNAGSAGVNISDTDSTVGARSGTVLPNWFAVDRWENIT